MRIPTLELVIPGSEPHMTIESAIQEAQARKACVWIPANYSGPDFVGPFPDGVPIYDMRNGGTIHANYIGSNSLDAGEF